MKRRGAILSISALLLASSALRFAAGMDTALASNTNGMTAQELEIPRENEPDSMEVAEAILPSTGSDKKMSRTDMTSLLDALKARETRASERERQIEMRAKALAVADQEIAKRLTALEQAEAALRATLSLANSAAEDDLTKLTAVYENMKPKDASALFEEMDPHFAAGFLGRMRPDSAADIMAGLSPDKAYSVSVILAGRNAKVPKT
ncbi:MAG: MotE family protein [Sulfitobacter sp.]